MSRNKATVRRYLDGFEKLDHAQILSCLTDDIRWTNFGWYRIRGKAAYDAHIEAPEFAGAVKFTVVRMVEEDDVVMAELAAEIPLKAGGISRMAMGEVFVMRDGLICERRGFVIELKENDYR